MFDSGEFAESFWTEAVNTAVYTLLGKVSAELWAKKVPSIGHLKVFVTACFIHIPKEKKEKMD